MKYTVDGNTVEVPDEFLAQAKKKYRLTNKKCIELYLAGQGFIDASVEDILKTSNATKSTRKSSRKPDDTKRGIVTLIANALAQEGHVVEVLNQERQIAINIDGAVYEITVTKKRKTQ
jgi:hypothetical protein